MNDKKRPDCASSRFRALQKNRFSPAEKAEKTGFSLRSASSQQREYVLRERVGLREHGDTGLLQDLRAGKFGRF